MKTPLSLVAILSALAVAGCATTHTKPAAFTDQQVSATIQHLRTVCLSLPLGSPVNVKFYEGASNEDKEIASANLTGYFYAYNKWNDTVTLSAQPPSFFHRGTPYYLASIETIALTAPSMVQAPDKTLLAEAVSPALVSHSDVLTQ
jgi:hypothetical protein